MILMKRRTIYALSYLHNGKTKLITNLTGVMRAISASAEQMHLHITNFLHKKAFN